MAVLLKAAANHPAAKITDRWMHRRFARHPYQTWRPFHPCALVEVRNCYGDPVIDVAHNLDWKYETDIGLVGECVIMHARQIFKNGKPVFRVKAASYNPRHLPVVIDNAHANLPAASLAKAS